MKVEEYRILVEGNKKWYPNTYTESFFAVEMALKLFSGKPVRVLKKVTFLWFFHYYKCTVVITSENQYRLTVRYGVLSVARDMPTELDFFKKLMG